MVHFKCICSKGTCCGGRRLLVRHQVFASVEYTILTSSTCTSFRATAAIGTSMLTSLIRLGHLIFAVSGPIATISAAAAGEARLTSPGFAELVHRTSSFTRRPSGPSGLAQSSLAKLAPSHYARREPCALRWFAVTAWYGVSRADLENRPPYLTPK